MATQLNRSNYSVLAWYTALKYQNDRTQERLGYGAYGVDVWPLVSEMYKLPPFQIIRPTDEGKGETVTSLKLHHVDTGTETEILSYLTTSGFNTETFADYDILVNPGQTAMTDITLVEGVYYAILVWGSGETEVTLYSEKFDMKPVLDDFKYVKVKFWHHDPFEIPIGHISYSDPFYNFCYFQTAINKPKFTREDTIVPNDGYEFPVYQISKKTFGFSGWVPEYMVDIIRLIEHHDFKTIEFDGILYEPVNFKIDVNEDAEKEGHVWYIRCEFEIEGPTQTTGRIMTEDEGFEYDQSEYDNSEFD